MDVPLELRAIQHGDTAHDQLAQSKVQLELGAYAAKQPVPPGSKGHTAQQHAIDSDHLTSGPPCLDAGDQFCRRRIAVLPWLYANAAH